LPHGGVDFELPVAVGKLDDKSADDDDDGAESISEDVKEHATHVQLSTGIYHTEQLKPIGCDEQLAAAGNCLGGGTDRGKCLRDIPGGIVSGGECSA